jgi:hypothetical protein
LASTQQRRSFPIRVEQVVRSATDKAARKAKADSQQQSPATGKRRPGRPKGRKNSPEADVPLTPELLRITGMLDALVKLIAGFLPLTYLLLDGHFSHHNALQMARQSHLHLISKLRGDAALYLPYTGPYAGAVRIASMAASSMTTICQSSTSKRPLWKGISTPACTRRNCCPESLRNR